jgi:CRISPR-associated endonuclease/helicase Cas3
MIEFYAHSIEGKPKSKWHLLEEHPKGTVQDLQTDNVMVSLSNHAAEFGSGEWAYLAGLWHDLGKYSEGLLL